MPNDPREMKGSARHALLPIQNHGDAVGVHSGYRPECIIYEPVEQLGRHHTPAFDPFHLAAHLVQIGRTERQIEFGGLEFDIGEIVREPRLSEKIIELPQSIFRLPRQCLVSDEDEPIRVLPPERLTQRVDGKADQPVTRRQPVDPRVNCIERLNPNMPDSSKAFSRMSRSMLSIIQGTWRTQQITLD
jgi:hypothetical protein